MTDLHTLLELATDEVESPDLGRSALASARRRHARRRGAVAAVAAGIAVGGVIVVPRVLDHTPDRTLPSQRLTPTPTPLPGQGAVAPPITDGAIQRAWDPSTVVDMPFSALNHLPTYLDPNGSSQSTPGDTTGPLALSRSDQDELAILYGDRGWFVLERPPGAGDLEDSSLSRDGSRVAVVGEGGLFWCPATVTCSTWTRVDVPRSVSREAVQITWTRSSDRLIVSSYRTGYLVDLESGDLTELPYLGDFTRYDVAPDGRIVSLSLGPRSVIEWDGTKQTRSTATGDLGGLVGLAAFEDAIAATRADLSYGDPRTASDGDGLVVLERDGLATRAFLPVTGEPGQWVGGEQIAPVQWINKITVLFSVLQDDTSAAGKVDLRHLVTWNILTGDLTRVASYPASADLSLVDMYPS